MRIERTDNSLDIYVAKDAIRSSMVSAASIPMLWLIGGARVALVILLSVALLVAPLVVLARRPSRLRPSLARQATPATL